MPLHLLHTDIERLLERLRETGVPVSNLLAIRVAIEDGLTAAPTPAPDYAITRPETPRSRSSTSFRAIRLEDDDDNT